MDSPTIRQASHGRLRTHLFELVSGIDFAVIRPDQHGCRTPVAGNLFIPIRGFRIWHRSRRAGRIIGPRIRADDAESSVSLAMSMDLDSVSLTVGSSTLPSEEPSVDWQRCVGRTAIVRPGIRLDAAARRQHDSRKHRHDAPDPTCSSHTLILPSETDDGEKRAHQPAATLTTRGADRRFWWCRPAGRAAGSGRNGRSRSFRARAAWPCYWGGCRRARCRSASGPT